jgi:ABC-2 type transport system permease protein
MQSHTRIIELLVSLCFRRSQKCVLQREANVGNGTLAWFAHHEARLAWRDWLAMMTAGRRRRVRTVAIALIVFVTFMHFVAYSMVGRFAGIGLDAGKVTLVAITGSLLLSWSLMLSQAMESVTRAFYSRSDLDLILSSPVMAQKVFAVRIATMAVSIALMSSLLAAPFINILVALGGPRWLCAYGVVAAMGLAAAACAVALTVALFKAIGPKRTRFVAQIVAAVIGAAFVIGLQIGAIVSYGNLSRTEVLGSDTFVALAPDVGSVAYWPALAVLGDTTALVSVLASGLLLLGLAMVVFSRRFGDHAIAAASIAGAVTRQQRWRASFRPATPRRALRQKEWTLLTRDPWLVSQTLMQILYLLPPAFLLWRSFGEGTGALLVLVPVLVMAAGQLAGGLAWLAISGEDAPVPARQIVRAKVEAVMGGIAIVFLPFIATLAILSPFHAAVCAVGVIIASASATQIQLWFRSQAKRTHFRRRQISSRMATFAEAFSSITWAGTAVLAAAGAWLAVPTGVIAVGILIGARLLSPHSVDERNRRPRMGLPAATT